MKSESSEIIKFLFFQKVILSPKIKKEDEKINCRVQTFRIKPEHRQIIKGNLYTFLFTVYFLKKKIQKILHT